MAEKLRQHFPPVYGAAKGLGVSFLQADIPNRPAAPRPRPYCAACGWVVGIGSARSRLNSVVRAFSASGCRCFWARVVHRRAANAQRKVCVQPCGGFAVFQPQRQSRKAHYIAARSARSTRPVIKAPCAGHTCSDGRSPVWNGHSITPRFTARP